MHSNYQRVTEGFDIMTRVLAPYVSGVLRERFGDRWWHQGVLGVLYDVQKRGLSAAGKDDELIAHLDAARCLILMDVHWNELFRHKLTRDHRTWIKELTETRNKWAHKGPLDTTSDDAWRALDTMARLVERMDQRATLRLRSLVREVPHGSPMSAATAMGSDASQRPKWKFPVGVGIVGAILVAIAIIQQPDMLGDVRDWSRGIVGLAPKDKCDPYYTRSHIVLETILTKSGKFLGYSINPENRLAMECQVRASIIRHIDEGGEWVSYLNKGDGIFIPNLLPPLAEWVSRDRIRISASKCHEALSGPSWRQSLDTCMIGHLLQVNADLITTEKNSYVVREDTKMLRVFFINYRIEGETPPYDTSPQ